MANRGKLPADSKRLKILMTEGSSISARQALYALGPQHTIDVLDPSPLCQCRFSRLVRQWVRCPAFAGEPCGYLRFLTSQICQGDYDVLLPTHEEIYLISRVKDSLEKLIHLAVPEFSAVQKLQSKIQFFELLDELTLPYPATGIFSSVDSLSEWHAFPAFAKLEFGTAGSTVRKVTNVKELQAAVTEFHGTGAWQSGEPIIVQQAANGVQSVARAVFSHGKLVASHASVLEQRGIGGAAVARKSALHSVVTSHLQLLGQSLCWHGPMFVEYFFDEESGSPQYIEADPRIGDIGNATASGVDLMASWLDVALNRQSFIASETYPIVRSHMGMLVLLSKALEGASRPEIAREIWRQWQGKGCYESSEEEMVRPRIDRLSVVPYAWVALRLLLRPSFANRVVGRTVENYSLGEGGAEKIAGMTDVELQACVEITQ